uniref:response regulator n=1 Tax=Paractinoplanes polyasparticus TaxID=2856853 RepID=UPI001C85A487|nr:response regulator [Actinoplanes polyasparticus]
MYTTPSRSRYVVLVVEDDPDVREIAAQVLRRCDFSILTAANAAEAVVACGVHEGPIHVLLTELALPGVSGDALARAAGSARPEMKVLYMSRLRREAAIGEGLLRHDAHFIAKPFTADLLVSALHNALLSQETTVNH